MHKYVNKILILFFLIASFKTFALNAEDSAKSQILFISPVEIPISLAGNFGELRPGHFHAGLDIRTQGKEDLLVRSIYDGYVSRIAISERGYGKVVYVTHPNGYTSVYAHLNRFNDDLEKYVKDYQYQNQTFELELYPKNEKYSLKQGERVGWSGNTGGSGGPHLHFEIRNTITEMPINPLHFGFKVEDNISPTLKNLSIYPLNDNSAVNKIGEQKIYKLIKSGGKYIIEGNSIPIIKGKIGFGIETIDKVNNSPFRNGVYSIELLKDGQRVYFHIMDSIAFNKSRCINAHMDFYQAKKNKRKVQRSYLLPGNKLNIYRDLVNEGQLFFVDSGTHFMEYRIKDFKGNESVLSFKVQSNQTEHQLAKKENPLQNLFYQKDNRFENENLRIEIPASCLYENTSLFLSTKPAIGRCVTPRYSINSLYEPLNDYMDVSINISSVPKEIRNKLVVVSLDSKSKVLAAEGGEVDSNWIKTKTRSFGPYTVMIDTLAPTVKLLTRVSDLGLKTNHRINFSVKDNISGLGKYEAFVDNQWHLIEYQRNKKTAFLKLDRVVKTGNKRDVRIEFTDKLGNKSTKSFAIDY